MSLTSPLTNLLGVKFLEGKIAVVTGSGRGIGKATAGVLARHGAQVCVVTRSAENASSTADWLIHAGGKAHPFPCDVSDSSAVEKTAQEILEKFQNIHILVNNAGVTRDGLLIRMKDEDWDEVIKTNLTGAFYFTRAVTKTMMKQREGRIVNISSVVGLIGNPGQANYCASKAGILGLTKSAAKELASRNITVNAIAPGFITTDMTEKLSDKVKEELTKQIPLGTLGTPEDVANTVLFLVSPLARYVTGQVLNVDGGMVM